MGTVTEKRKVEIKEVFMGVSILLFIIKRDCIRCDEHPIFCKDCIDLNFIKDIEKWI